MFELIITNSFISSEFIEGDFDSLYMTHIIPLHTVKVDVAINREFSNINDNYCLVDNIKFNIFEKQNN